ncbi:MAG TPA: GIY-YIG nuclease family protein [Patescibacteria group bacterium]
MKNLNKSCFIYVLTNWNDKVMYVGMTNDLERRISEHKSKLIDGFTKKYNLTKLVYFEEFNNPEEAIGAEKKIKGWLRSKKNALVESINPEWEDLSGLDPSLRSG